MNVYRVVRSATEVRIDRMVPKQDLSKWEWVLSLSPCYFVILGGEAKRVDTVSNEDLITALVEGLNG